MLTIKSTNLTFQTMTNIWYEGEEGIVDLDIDRHMEMKNRKLKLDSIRRLNMQETRTLIQRRAQLQR
jgi:hypothetical protein